MTPLTQRRRSSSSAFSLASSCHPRASCFGRGETAVVGSATVVEPLCLGEAPRARCPRMLCSCRVSPCPSEQTCPARVVRTQVAVRVDVVGTSSGTWTSSTSSVSGSPRKVSSTWVGKPVLHQVAL